GVSVVRGRGAGGGGGAVPADGGEATVQRLGGGAGPIAQSGSHRWMLFCTAEPDPVEASEDDLRAGLLVHTQGSWVPVPARGRARGKAGWIRPPWVVGWRLPGTRDVLAAARAVARPAGFRVAGFDPTPAGPLEPPQ